MSKITMLQTKIWLYVAVFGSTIIVALWVLQVVFFDAAYMNRERYVIQNLGQAIAEDYKEVRVFEDTYLKYYHDDVPVRIFNEPGIKGETQVLELSDPDPLDIRSFIERYESLGKAEMMEMVDDPSVVNSRFYIYGTKILNEDAPEYSLYIYVISPLGSVGATQEVLRQQLFFVVILFVLLSILVSYYISSEIAKPMIKLTDAARLLAEGDYSVEFQSDDYTEINELANVLNYAKTELAKTDQLKSQLMANVSHDLRTPLTMIKAYAEMIRDLSGDNPEKRKDHIDIIIQESDWMSCLITDILEYSKIQSGNIKYEIHAFDLCEVSRGNVGRFKELALKNGIEIVLECPESAMVTGDVKMINRVINNLISNALNHSEDHSKLTVSIEMGKRRQEYQKDSKENKAHKDQKDKRNSKSTEVFLWQVRDYGSGIEPEKLDQIWNSYFSSGDSMKRLTSGTGLGLSIVQGILSDHHARFGVESQVGQGTVFWFELNAASGDDL